MTTAIDKVGCVGNTIKVAQGHYVSLLEPDPATIEIRSIAAALSKTCRYGGHCPDFYSVAEHSIHAANLARATGFDTWVVRAVFLHDAAEAYLGDMVKPLKSAMPAYRVVEERMEAAIAAAFNVDFQRWHAVIKRFDWIMLKAEKAALWPDDTDVWPGLENVEDRDVTFRFWDPTYAEEEFLAAAMTLGIPLEVSR